MPLYKMSSRQLPRRHNNFIRPPPTPPLRSLRYKYTFAAHPDTIDDILSTCLNWVLPVLFFFVIIVLVTMLTSYTLVMRRPLPRVFTFVIVITFSVQVTITFFILVAFHMYRCQRVRSMLSEVRIILPLSGLQTPPLFKARIERIDQFMISNLGKPSAQPLTDFIHLGLPRR